MEHGIVAHSLAHLRTVEALVAVSALEASHAQDQVKQRDASRRCRRAYRTSRSKRVFSVALPSSMRMMGTIAWIRGKVAVAGYWWKRSLEAAEVRRTNWV